MTHTHIELNSVDGGGEIPIFFFFWFFILSKGPSVVFWLHLRDVLGVFEIASRLKT